MSQPIYSVFHTAGANTLPALNNFAQKMSKGIPTAGQKIMGYGLALLFLISCSLLFSSALYAQEDNIELPELGDASSGIVAPQQEFLLGRIWLRQLRAQANTYPDPAAQYYIEDLIYRLLPNSEVRDARLEFVVIDQAELNAFAVPGGIIGVNMGIFLYAQDEDELAAVLAHELAHLSQRHFARRIEAAEKQTPLTMASILASILLIASSNPDAGMAGLVGAQAASIQSQLAFSREWEREADRVGIKTLAQAEFNPGAMPSMFRQMLAANRYSQRPPEFLLTHPVTESRVADAAGRAESYLQNIDEKIRTKRQQSLNFLILKQQALLRYHVPANEVDAYLTQQADKLSDSTQANNQNLLDSVYFSHAGYLIAKAKQQNQQGDLKNNKKINTLISQISSKHQQHAAVVMLKSDAFVLQNKASKASKVLAASYTLNPNNYLLALKLIEIDSQEKNYKAAIELAVHWSQVRKNDPNIWQVLARTAHSAQDKLKSYRAQGEYLFLLGQKQKALRQMELALKQAQKEKNIHQQASIRQRLISISNSSQDLDI